MSDPFRNAVKKLKAVSARFDPASNALKLRLLQDLSRSVPKSPKAWIAYGDLLLFLQAYPPDRRVLQAARSEMARLARVLAKPGMRSHPALTNSGLPYAALVPKFSHDQTSWIAEQPDLRVDLDRFEEPTFDLNRVLAVTLPTMEASATTWGHSNTALLETLGIRRGQEVPFLLSELKELDDRPRVKDLLFENLGLYVRIRPRNRSVSKAYNTVHRGRPFFHDGIVKEFDQRALLDRPLPAMADLDGKTKSDLVRAIKLSMVLTDRETDPVTYMDERTIRLYELERGIMIAIHGMVPARQLPMESYIGYTLFKNGFPAAYGGAWVFGERADFGINIFETFRGGESGYMMCQLLRVFRQVFKVGHFEIEPYQFGLDNPDGIETGAFWFYHKHGFRPTDKALLALSEREVERRRKNSDHRSSKPVLQRFTESNMALVLQECGHPGVYAITEKVTHLIRSAYNGDRARAVAESVKRYGGRHRDRSKMGADTVRVMQEVALWAEAFGITDPDALALMDRMVALKATDPYRYQDVLLRFFKRS